MKFRGRIGPAALIGIGTWIRSDEDGNVAASTCSGMMEIVYSERLYSDIVEFRHGGANGPYHDCV